MGELSGSCEDIVSFFEEQGVVGQRYDQCECVVANFLRERLGHWPNFCVKVTSAQVIIRSGDISVTRSISGTPLGEVICCFDNRELPQLDVAPGLLLENELPDEAVSEPAIEGQLAAA
jgi:hypothetical protein